MTAVRNLLAIFSFLNFCMCLRHVCLMCIKNNWKKSDRNGNVIVKMLIHSHHSSFQFPPTFQFPFSYESHPNFSLMGEVDGHRHLCLYSRNSVYVGSVAILSVQLTVSSFTVTCIVNTEFTDHVKKVKVAHTRLPSVAFWS